MQKINENYFLLRVRSVMLTILISIIACGCETPDGVQTLETGDWNVLVNIKTYDEFYRRVPVTGSVSVHLNSKDRALHQIISNGDSVAMFKNLPYQAYIATVNQSGYFTSTVSNPFNDNYKSIPISVELYPIPSVTTKIDSIHYQINSVLPQIFFQLYTAQTLPFDGQRSAILFVGLTSEVSSVFGTYVCSLDEIIQSPGSSKIETKDLYREMRTFGIPVGSRIYVTARIKSGATLVSTDQKTGLAIYNNLENNTRSVTSFIMP